MTKFREANSWVISRLKGHTTKPIAPKGTQLIYCNVDTHKNKAYLATITYLGRERVGEEEQEEEGEEGEEETGGQSSPRVL